MAYKQLKRMGVVGMAVALSVATPATTVMTMADEIANESVAEIDTEAPTEKQTDAQTEMVMQVAANEAQPAEEKAGGGTINVSNDGISHPDDTYGVEIDGSKATIIKDGTYVVSGASKDVKIVVSKGLSDVTLKVSDAIASQDGATIVAKSPTTIEYDGASIYGVDAQSNVEMKGTGSLFGTSLPSMSKTQIKGNGGSAGDDVVVVAEDGTPIFNTTLIKDVSDFVLIDDSIQPATKYKLSVGGVETDVMSTDENGTDVPLPEEPSEEQPEQGEGQEGQEGQEPTGQEGQEPSGQEGQEPTGQEGQEPSGQEGQEPSGQEGQEPSGQEGQEPSGQEGQEPSGQEGQEPSGQEGQEPSGQEGQEPSGQEGQEPSGQEGENPTGQEGENPTGQEGENPSGQEGENQPGENVELVNVNFVYTYNESTQIGVRVVNTYFGDDGKVINSKSAVDAANNVSAGYTVAYTKGKPIGVVPEVEVLANSTFDGWYDEAGNKLTKGTVPTNGASYVAKYTNKPVEQGGEQVSMVNVSFITSYNEANKTGVKLVSTDFGSNSKYITSKKATDSAGNVSEGYSVNYISGKSVKLVPEVKVLENSTFNGWFDVNGNQLTKDTVPVAGAVYTARYTNKSNETPTAITPSNTTGTVPANPTATAAPNSIENYTLTVVSATGSTQRVTVRFDVKLSDLATKLGYNVATWHVKQANVAEYAIDGSMTMSALVDLLKNGDLLLIAYDATGNAMGSAKVIKETDSSMTVTLSKDTNVALRSAAEIAEQNGKTSDAGKGATSTTTEGGKQDAVAPSQRTADSVALPFYGALGSLSAALLGILTFLRRKFRR